MTREDAARLEHLGLTKPCDDCRGRGWYQGVHSYEPMVDCEYCKGKGFVVTATGEALIELIRDAIK